MHLNTAVFFDFENFVINCNIDNFMQKYQEQFVDRIKQETDGSDFAFVKIYADWSSPRFKTFSSFILEHGMEAVQVFGYSNTQEAKNIADFMMSLDILETALTKPHIENFIICTGDAGFSVIVNRLKALGKKTLIYRPERNYSRYLEKLADVCIGIEAEVHKRVNIKVPPTDKAITISHPFTTNDLPSADKLNVKIMNPESLKNFEAFGLTVYEADCSKQEVGEIIFGILQILTTLNIYSQHPQIVASISLLSLMLEHYIEKFSAKNYGHKTLSKLIGDLFTGTQFKMVRRNKESQYYVVVSESGLRSLFSNVTVAPLKDDEKPPALTEEKLVEKPCDKPSEKPPIKANGKQNKIQAKKHVLKPSAKPPTDVKNTSDESTSANHANPVVPAVTSNVSQNDAAVPSESPTVNQADSSTPESTPAVSQTNASIQDEAMQSEKPAAEALAAPETKAITEKQENRASNIKMNDYIRVSITLMLKKSLLTNEDFENLLDEKHCKEKFGIAHPLLKEVSTPFFPGSELQINGKKVYWKRIFKHDGRYFLIYGDWEHSQNKQFIMWADSYLK